MAYSYRFPDAPSSGGTPYTLAAAAGTLTLSGSTVTFPRLRNLVGSPGTLTLTGTAHTFSWGRAFVGSPGALTLNGSSATLAHGRSLAGSAGTLSLTGASATMAHGRSVVASPGALTLNGAAVTFEKHGLVTLVAAPGALVLNGSAATFVYTHPTAYSLAASPGALSLSGSGVIFVSVGSSGGKGGWNAYYYKKRKKAPLQERAEEVKEAFEQLTALVPEDASVYVDKAQRKAELAVEKLDALKTIESNYAALLASAERAIEIFQTRLKAQAEEDEEEEIALIMAALQD